MVSFWPLGAPQSEIGTIVYQWTLRECRSFKGCEFDFGSLPCTPQVILKYINHNCNDRIGLVSQAWLDNYLLHIVSFILLYCSAVQLNNLSYRSASDRSPNSTSHRPVSNSWQRVTQIRRQDWFVTFADRRRLCRVQSSPDVRNRPGCWRHSTAQDSINGRPAQYPTKWAQGATLIQDVSNEFCRLQTDCM